MTFPYAYRRRGLPAAGLVTAIAVLAACGSSGRPAAPPAAPPAVSPAASSPSPSQSSAPEPTSPSAAAAAIKANWAEFFDAKLPVARRVAFLQDSETFAPFVRAEQVGDPLAAEVTGWVTRVHVTTATRAAVTYTIALSGKPVLVNQLGTSVYERGIWKVSDGTLCGFLTLKGGGSKSKLPAACKAIS